MARVLVVEDGDNIAVALDPCWSATAMPIPACPKAPRF